MDCVRTAVRQGATSVKCLYRRDRANMPGSQREVQNAEEEGVEFVWLTTPSAFAGKDRVAAVVVQRMRLGAPDASGRQMPEVIDNADYLEPADLVITALGFEPEALPEQWQTPDLGVTRWGTIKAHFQTHVPIWTACLLRVISFAVQALWFGPFATGAKLRMLCWLI